MTLRSSFPLLRTKIHIFPYITSKCYEKIYPRNYLGVASQEILEEIFVEMLLTQEICSSGHRNLNGC